MLSNVDMVEQDIKDCSRCGGNHSQLTFQPFTRSRPDRYTHWCLCPTNGEPILYRLENEAGKLVVVRMDCGQVE